MKSPFFAILYKSKFGWSKFTPKLLQVFFFPKLLQIYVVLHVLEALFRRFSLKTRDETKDLEFESNIFYFKFRIKLQKKLRMKKLS